VAKEPENLVLEHLRAIREVLDQHTRSFADVQLRLSGIETHMAGFQISEVRQNTELDGLRSRIERIEKRLELVESK
jgi:tetrahydromethanopterin S-methyltransferase subunit G